MNIADGEHDSTAVPQSDSRVINVFRARLKLTRHELYSVAASLVVSTVVCRIDNAISAVSRMQVVAMRRKQKPEEMVVEIEEV